MKGFTLWEPWATLMALRFKLWETRGWYTHYRGPLVIHAAKTTKHLGVPRRLLAEAGIIRNRFAELPEGFPSRPSEWPLGKIVAVCNLVDCIPTEKAIERGLTQMERACGDYGAGRFAWLTEGLVKLETPIPWKGKQGFWKIPEELAARLPALALTKG